MKQKDDVNCGKWRRVVSYWEGCIVTVGSKISSAFSLYTGYNMKLKTRFRA